MAKRKKGRTPVEAPAPDETAGAVEVPQGEGAETPPFEGDVEDVRAEAGRAWSHDEVAEYHRQKLTPPEAVPQDEAAGQPGEELITVEPGAEQIEVKEGVVVTIPAGTYAGQEFDDLVSQAIAEAGAPDGLVARVPPEAPKLNPRDPGPYLAAIGLEPAHILASRVLDDGRLRIVTVGGKKLVLPDDEAKAKALTPGERDGVVRTTKHINTHAINAGRKK